MTGAVPPRKRLPVQLSFTVLNLSFTIIFYPSYLSTFIWGWVDEDQCLCLFVFFLFVSVCYFPSGWADASCLSVTIRTYISTQPYIITAPLIQQHQQQRQQLSSNVVRVEQTYWPMVVEWCRIQSRELTVRNTCGKCLWCLDVKHPETERMCPICITGEYAQGLSVVVWLVYSRVM